MKDGAAAVADDSRYGTYLNGQRIPADQQFHPLSEGDTLALGGPASAHPRATLAPKVVLIHQQINKKYSIK